MVKLDFKLIPVKRKQKKKLKTRARKGRAITKDTLTCFDCPNVRKFNQLITKELMYVCKLDVLKEAKVIPKIIASCVLMKKPKAPLKADYIQQAYQDVKRWKE